MCHVAFLCYWVQKNYTKGHDYMKKYRIVSMILVVVLLVGSTISASATTFKLNITAREQEESNWCWAAVSLMIIDYLHTWSPLPTQSDIVTTLKGSAVNEGATPQEMTNVLGWYMVSTTNTSTKSFSTVKNMLSGWYSTIGTGVAWTNGGAHAQLIYGYEENSPYQGLYVIDPWPNTARRVYYNYDEYKSNTEHVWYQTWYNNKKKS